MKGFQRLITFCVVAWVGFWFVAYLIDGGPFNWPGFVLFAVVPVAVVVGIPAGVFWVIRGYQTNAKGAQR